MEAVLREIHLGRTKGENPMNSMKRQNDRILKDEFPRLGGAQYATGGEWRNNTRKNEGMEPKHVILCHPILFLPPIPPSIRVFSNASTLCMRWPKYWSFSFSIIPSKEIPGLISFRMDWLDLLAVQGTLKSLLQHHSSKASILRCSAFFTVQLSHPYMTTGKIIALTR